MAEMLIDGAKLDACNTAEADAIRAKTGGTDPIPYDYANNKGFADAIAAIPSGGGEKVYTKLAETTITEPVHSVNITITEKMKSCECLYLVADSITLSEDDWVYPNLNGSGFFGYTPKVSSLSAIFLFAPIVKPTEFARRGVIASGVNVSGSGVNNATSLSTIGMYAYNNTTNFTSGKLEIWGYV